MVTVRPMRKNTPKPTKKVPLGFLTIRLQVRLCHGSGFVGWIGLGGGSTGVCIEFVDSEDKSSIESFLNYYNAIPIENSQFHQSYRPY